MTTEDKNNLKAGNNPSGPQALEPDKENTGTLGFSREEDSSETVLVVDGRNFFPRLFEKEARVHILMPRIAGICWLI